MYLSNPREIDYHEKHFHYMRKTACERALSEIMEKNEGTCISCGSDYLMVQLCSMSTL